MLPKIICFILTYFKFFKMYSRSDTNLFFPGSTTLQQNECKFTTHNKHEIRSGFCVVCVLIGLYYKLHHATNNLSPFCHHFVSI